MARHKQCQKLGGSRNADWSDPSLMSKKQDDPSPKGGRVGKLNCSKMLLSCKTAKGNALGQCSVAYIARQCLRVRPIDKVVL